MKLVSLLCSDPNLAQMLTSFLHHDFYLQESKPQRLLGPLLAGLEPLGFAGAIVLDRDLQNRVSEQLERQSLSAKDASAVDTLVVTPAGLLGEYSFAQAVVAQLYTLHWDARGARGVILGSGSEAIALSRELSSLGLSHLSLIAENRPLAERAKKGIAATTEFEAVSLDSPLAQSFIEQADLLVRLYPNIRVKANLLGPHLCVVDLSPDPLSLLREQAIRVGAQTISYRDIQAHQLALMLETILGQDVSPEPFLQLFHSQMA